MKAFNHECSSLHKAILTNACTAWVLRLRASRSAQDDRGEYCFAQPCTERSGACTAESNVTKTIGLAQNKLLTAYEAIDLTILVLKLGLLCLAPANR